MKREEQIRKKAKELGQQYFPDSSNIWARSNVEACYVENACVEMAEWLDQHPHWIPIEERKPQERGHYLVYSQFGDVWLSEWMQDKEGRWDWYVAPICVGIISKVTHWMPLPPAPRKEE
jgi:hypothetical protein